MLENADANTPSRDDERKYSSADYLQRAMQACAEGDAMLGLTLYLAAYENAAGESDMPSEDAIMGLKQAWTLACANKERSLAEYIFEKLEPFLSSDEIEICAQQLQNLALDKLEEFGLTREDLEDMTEMISQDFLGFDAQVVKLERIPIGPQGIEGPIEVSGQLPGADEAASSPEEPSKKKEAEGNEKPKETKPKEGKSKPTGSVSIMTTTVSPSGHGGSTETYEPLTYDKLAGYDTVVQTMRDYGIGMQDDPDFQNLVKLLNHRHGLEGMPAADTLLFRSPAREDAGRFVEATIGELRLPVLRMHMEESLQGLPVLCVTAQAEDVPKINPLRNALANGGVLVMEDIDLWNVPISDSADDMGNFLMAQISRGAREAINLVRSSVENPDVYVLATAALDSDIDGFFLDLLEPLSLVDIDYPNEMERHGIWLDIMGEHPSIRGVDVDDLVRLSAHMPRFDIYMAAREAVEEAYKVGLMARDYRSVTRENIFEKLAAYQPLDSKEYHELEEAVVSGFRSSLGDIDELLGF